jgi:hypothetical protein
MSKRSFSIATATSGAGTANNVTVGTSGFMALLGGSATLLIDFLEILISGFATSSAPALMLFARNSTIGATPTAIADPAADGPLHPSSAAAAIGTPYIAAATGPVRSSSVTAAKLNLGLNLFGGIIRWQAAPTQQFSMLGNTASLGEVSLSAYTGTTSGTYGAHIIYEGY